MDSLIHTLINRSPDNVSFNPDSSAAELLRLLPPVLRARDFHLYLDGGQRLTDLWQLGGKAVLGHKPSQVVRELKNAAERGLFAPLPHPLEKRFHKALAKLFPLTDSGQKYCFRLYSDEKSLEKALENARPGAGAGDGDCVSSKEAQLYLWRPFLDLPIPAEKPLLIPILPWAFSPVVLVLKESLDSHFPPGDLLSPVILAAGVRAIYNLIAAGDNGGRPVYHKINKVLYKSNTWKRQGIYLYQKPADHEGENIAPNDWTGLWKHFLEQGFLLPPSPKEPLILPGILSAGEEAKLANLLSGTPLSK